MNYPTLKEDAPDTIGRRPHRRRPRVVHTATPQAAGRSLFGPQNSIFGVQTQATYFTRREGSVRAAVTRTVVPRQCSPVFECLGKRLVIYWLGSARAADLPEATFYFFGNGMVYHCPKNK